MSPRGTVRALACLLCILVGLAATFSGAASAKPKCEKSNPGHGSSSYPPKSCQARTSSSQVSPGGTVRVWGDGFSPTEWVSIDLHSTPVRVARVLATETTTNLPGPTGGSVTYIAGTAVADVVIPQNTSIGKHFLSLLGESSGEYLTAEIEVVPPTLPRSDRDGGGLVGGLPFTGLELVELLAFGVGLCAVGVAVFSTGRRRGRRRRRRPVRT